MSRPPDDLSKLSPSHCMLLAAHFASESDISSLRALVSIRHDCLQSETVLRIILSYLPETVTPEQYAGLVDSVTNGSLSELDNISPIKTDAVSSLSNSSVRKRVKELHLLPLAHPSFSPSEYPEQLVQFIIHRAHQIDQQTGLLNLIPQLVSPFIDRFASLRTWFISCVLPLLRFEYEYYRQDQRTYTLNQVELADNAQGPEIWLSDSLNSQLSKEGDGRRRGNGGEYNNLARDLRCMVGPWMYGERERKRRRLNREITKSDLADGNNDAKSQDTTTALEGSRHAWSPTFNYLIQTASQNLPAVTEVFEHWRGAVDTDLGGYDNHMHYMADEEEELARKYIQTGFSSIYAAENNDTETISAAYGIISTIAPLMRFHTLPDIQSQLDNLSSLTPPITESFDHLQKSDLDRDTFLDAKNSLTSKEAQSFALVRHLILSASVLSNFGHPITISGTLKIKFFLDREEQSSLFQKILHFLTTSQRLSRSAWPGARLKLLWLWGWGSETSKPENGQGIFGKISRSSLEKDILEALVSSACYSEVVNIYIKDSSGHILSTKESEEVIVSTALQQYDNASNGNRTRGSMKHAADIVSALGKYYPDSVAFRRLQALITATHAMSSYSLTLQHGVPFQPVNIRVSSDPISLIEKILAQNPGSYAKLQDLISIGRNLVAAGLTSASFDDHDDEQMTELSSVALEEAQSRAQRRVIGMAIEAALQEDDFETAYSYVVNSLDTSRAGQFSSPSSASDNVAWRAALAAGRHKSAPSSMSASGSLSTSLTLRRLEQRMDLLSQALLLAPPSALPEILSAWRKCEEETTALLASDVLRDDDDSAFATPEPSDIPGAFIDSTAAPRQAPRREVGRGTGEDSPMGLFDVARDAAQAFSRSAFPLRGAAVAASRTSAEGARPGSMLGSDGGSEDGQGRVRKRDMVANAVTGGLASGIGWVLGATPMQQNQQR